MDKSQQLRKTLGYLQEIADFTKKNAEFRDIKMLKTNPLLLEKNAMPLCQTLEEIDWSLKLEKLKK